jgi:hypothetical protein
MVISEVLGFAVAHHPLMEEQMTAGARAALIPESAIGYVAVVYCIVPAGYDADVTGDVRQGIKRRPMSYRGYAQRHAPTWMAQSRRIRGPEIEYDESR